MSEHYGEVFDLSAGMAADPVAMEFVRERAALSAVRLGAITDFRFQAFECPADPSCPLWDWDGDMDDEDYPGPHGHAFRKGRRP